MEFYATDEICKNYTNATLYSKKIPQTIMRYLRQIRKMDTDDDHRFDVLVDAGCGSGASTRLFAPYFRSIIGFDPSESQLKIARSKGQDNIKYMKGCGEDMPVKSGSADLITSGFSVQYMDISKFTGECNRVLKEDGCAALFGFDYVDLRMRNGDGVLSGEDSAVKRLLQSYIDSLTNYFIETKNMEFRAMERFQNIYSEIEGMKKERVDDLTFEVDMTLEEYVAQFMAVPTFKLHEEASETNNLAEFIGRLKKHWGVSDVDNAAINVQSILSLFFVFLEKNSCCK